MEKYHEQEQKMRDWWESNYYYPEQHWARLAYHIPLRGADAGSAVGMMLGIPFALWKRPQTVGRTVGTAAMSFGLAGMTAMVAAAVHKFQTTEEAGIVDRSYRLAHNWGQAKWDLLSVGGFTTFFLLAPNAFGGRIRGGFIGMALGAFAWAGQNAVSKTAKTDVEKLKQMTK